MSLLSVAVLVACGYGYTNLTSFQQNLTTTDVISEHGGGDKPLDGAVDILLVGMDSRTDSKGNPLPQQVLDELQAGGSDDGGFNTDTMILLHIPNNGSRAVAISFPRDSYVDIAGGYGKHKLNSAYGAAKNDAAAELTAKGETDKAVVETQSRQAGARNLIATIENLTGVTVDHYAEVNLAGFYEITKAIGGVDVCLTNAVDEPKSGARFTAGEHTIEGKDALAFVRQRYDLPRGDLDRIVRQQVFLAGLATKILSTGVLTDQTKLHDLIQAVTKAVILDKDWDILGFAGQMHGLSGGNIEFTTIPTGSLDLRTPEDGSAVEVDDAQVRAFVQSLTADPPPSGSPTTSAPTSPAGAAKPEQAHVRVDVRNGSGIPGLATSVLGTLTAQGYGEGTTGNAEKTLATSVVLYGTGAEAGAASVAKSLGGLPVRSDLVVPEGTVRVFLGQDYTGPQTSRFANSPNIALDGKRQPVTPAEQPITAGGISCVN
ncbi:LCP family protein [Umezawaea sp. NPDC059074]|uniref:LCP family protein n=1 Tax=Umezawaea sp. NPDC059074 TaxID=3346716 RepID=UPI00368DE0D2